MRFAPARRIRTRPIALAATVAATAALAGCTTHQVPPLSAAAIAGAREFKQYTIYWAGLQVGNARLTQADSPLYFYNSAQIGFTMYYGNCEPRGGLRDGGCTLPLKITTSFYTAHSDASFGPQRWVHFHGVPAVIYDGGDDIEIYTQSKQVDIVADSPARALAAAQALTPFNRGVSVDDPAFPAPYYTPNPSEAELNAPPAGATTATGATSNIAPPSVLEPTPPGTNGT
jgi:hypothetical protein